MWKKYSALLIISPQLYLQLIMATDLIRSKTRYTMDKECEEQSEALLTTTSSYKNQTYRQHRLCLMHIVIVESFLLFLIVIAFIYTRQTHLDSPFTVFCMLFLLLLHDF